MGGNERAGARPPTRESLEEYGRGIAGGLLFSLPLLYTMEMWQFGPSAHPSRLLIYVAATFILLLGYNRFAGLRYDASWSEIFIDSVEEIGIGLVLSALVLTFLGRLDQTMTLSELTGKVVLTAMTVAIGVSVGTSQLGGSTEEDSGSFEDATESGPPGIGQHLVLAFIGAVLIGGNIAPTEEVLLLGVEVASVKLLGVIGASLVLAAIILFYSSFRNTEGVGDGGLVLVMRRTVVTYAVALCAAALVLWFFDRFSGISSIHSVSQVVVLGGATTLGASAGKLLIK